MENTRRRNYSDPIPSYQTCQECNNDFKRSQQHYDWQYQKSGICSWPCVINRSNDIEQYNKAKAREIIRIFFDTIEASQLQ